MYLYDRPSHYLYIALSLENILKELEILLYNVVSFSSILSP